MSGPIKDGGPAFPLNPEVNFSHKGEVYPEAMGMSLRDWFAGQALMSMLTSPTQIKEGSCESYDLAARLSYRFADAMLAAREASS